MVSAHGRSITDVADVVVLGSGPGGSVTACLLAEAGSDVLLVEEGHHWDPASAPAFSRQEMVQKYRNGGLTLALGRTKVAYVEGCCVGGGSEINSALYHRTPPDVLEEWRRRQRIDSFDPSELARCFEANERELAVATAPGPAPEASLRLADGAHALGWSAVEVPRWVVSDPSSTDSAAGIKQTMTRTYVPRALAAGARLLSGTRAVRLERRRGRWRISAERRGPEGTRQRLTLEAPRVFVACGAVHTPALLRRSGLAPRAGGRLHLHPTVKVVARFPRQVNRADMGVPSHQVKQFAPRISLGCSISTPAHLKLALLDHPGAERSVDEHWSHMAIYYAMTLGGRGSVAPIPGFRDPLVRYRLSRADMVELAEALRLLCRCLFAAGAEELYPSVAGWPSLKHENDLDALPDCLPQRRTNLMTVHLFSSCPMGESSAYCVADSFGRVHGEEGLWLADASLLPGPPGVNPQGSVMAIARRNAVRFLAQS